ncbi:MAG: pentapeptide repeat-containing protein [Thermodesulfobacteriota bacterium]
MIACRETIQSLVLHQTRPEPRLWDPGLAELSRQAAAEQGMRPDELARELADLWGKAFEESLSRRVSLVLPDLRGELLPVQFPETSGYVAYLDPFFPQAHPLWASFTIRAGSTLRPFLGEARAVRVLCEAADGFFTTAQRICMENGSFKGAGRFLARLEARYKAGDGPLLAHMNEVLCRFQARPMPLTGTFSLHRAYVVPLAARSVHEPGRSASLAAAVPDLVSSVIADLDREPIPIVIHGLPGHGKTSAALALSHALSPVGRLPATGFLFCEFKSLVHLESGGEEALRRRLPFVYGEDFFHGKRLVLILDGMDDCRCSEGPDLFFKDFVRDLARMARRVNRRADSRLDLVLTGRSRFFAKVRTSLPAPFIEYEIADFDSRRVGAWLDNWSREKGLETRLCLGDLERNNLDELSGQPVLLCLSALLLSDRTGNGSRPPVPEPDRRGIYRTIVSWTYHKLWHQDPRPADFPDRKTYTALLRAAAFALHQEGGNTISMDRLASRLAEGRERHQLCDILPHEPDRVRAVCEKLALLFFVSADPGNSFSFVHETFRHHLCAEEMFSLLSGLVTDFAPEQAEASCREMAPELYGLLGRAPLNEEIMGFCRPIMASSRREAEAILEALSAFFLRAQDRRYLPFCISTNGSDPYRIHACVLHGLFCWISELRRTLYPDSRKNGHLPDLFPDKGGLARFLSALAAARHPFSEGFPLDFSGMDMAGQDLSRLPLTASCMENVVLRRANLSGASLAGSFLINAELGETDLSGADLSCAYLDHAKCQGADFSRALLRDARMDCAKLHGAVLRSALFIRTDLSGADLSGTDLSGAVFLDAVTDGVRWDGANKEEAVFVATRSR